ncbi:NAD(P)H-dependent oxidoreductase [Oceanicola sp. S124]|uniref:NAD(P)H-dependent oxidoreductase n=1 Tax=Oceanicola sp. S124 TaxID=1042378 RepID=UPI0002557A96|nr:NAD(P)H-dependent oxidoreductase [Oceanicola sp. S124]
MLTDKLNWRYATKKMDPSRPVAEEKVARIVEAIQMAPTSSGVQPFELFVVKNPEVRAQLREAAFDQSQLTDGSHVLVFAAWDNYSEERLDAVLAQNLAERGENEGLRAYYTRLKSMYLPRDAGTNHDHAARQAYIALGFALAMAAELEVDSTPMEGFDADRFDEILGLKEKGLHAVLTLPLGYREADNDWLLPMKKIRKPLDELVTEIA